jgi:hypothetical protein
VSEVYKIFADYERIFLDNWNHAYGNKILHILFLVNICEIKKRLPVMYKGSNLDALFNFKFETISISTAMRSDYYFVEPDPFGAMIVRLAGKIKVYFKPDFLLDKVADFLLDKVVAAARDAHLIEIDFLRNAILPQRDISIKGHFFEYELMPSIDVFNKYISIKNSVIEKIKNKYEGMTHKNSVAVHFRGTDYDSHLRHVFKSGIGLDRDYYKKSIDFVEAVLGDHVVFHLFSDDLDSLVNIFKHKKIVVHNDDAVHDWASIFLIPNVIQSNSSYCWTASLFNKVLSVQPHHGHNYHRRNGSIPFGFAHANAHIIR